MHGDDFDQGFITFQTHGIAFSGRAVGGLADLIQQPLLQRGGAVALLVFGGQQFQQLMIVGQTAFVTLGQQP